jgi:hypothetical protein
MTHRLLPRRGAGLALAVAVLISLGSCKRGPVPTAGVRVVPQPPGAVAAAAPVPPAVDTHFDAGTLRPRIVVDPGDTVLQVVNANLDQTPYGKQVIAVKRTGEVDSPIRIIVADADPARGTYYYQSWESPTNATDTRVFSLSVKDLVGDHVMEIVASGMNSAGKLTIDVFRPVAPPQGKELTYKPICQLVADEISIEETDRAESYSTDPKPGPGFPVVAYLRDPDSQNVMDLVRIRYSWNPAEGRYVPGSPEKIPGEKVQQTQLETLYNSSGEEVFEQFISGSWVQLKPAKVGKGPDSYLSIINFDPRGRKIALSSGNTQEVYLWRESHRTIYNSLLAIGENETVLEIHLGSRFNITVDSVNTLTVTIGGRDSEESRTVKYVKVTDDIQAKLIGRPDAQVALAPMTLSGTYAGTDGLSIDFEGSRLTWSAMGQHRNGSYVLFSFGTRTLLSMRMIGTRGTPDQITSWLVDFRERKDSVRVVRTLRLSPVLLTVKGYEEAKGDSLLLEQTQELKKK